MGRRAGKGGGKVVVVLQTELGFSLFFFVTKGGRKAGDGRGDQEAFRLGLEKCGALWW